MAPATTSSILSTHSGHHRIFIGPVVQKQASASNHNIGNNSGTGSNVSSSSRHSNTTKSKSKHLAHNHTNHSLSPHAPRPWWDQSSSLIKSHLSLNHASQPGTPPPHLYPSTSGNKKNKKDNNATNAITTAPVRPTTLQQTSIPQLSYTFSDDTSSSGNSNSDNDENETEDEENGMYDSEEERQDYEQDRDETDGDDELDDELDDHVGDKAPRDRSASWLKGKQSQRQEQLALGQGHEIQTSTSTNSSSSAESVSARVEHSLQYLDADHDYSHDDRSQGPDPSQAHPDKNKTTSKDAKDTKENKKNNRNSAATATTDTSTLDRSSLPGASMVTRWSSKEKKRTKSLRDEGEPNRFKKFFGVGHHREKRQGRVDDPDLGWESDGSRASRPRITRQVTSGALTVGHHHSHDDPVLVSSPLSSDCDLPNSKKNSNNHGEPGFVSSPISSDLDDDVLERPDPRPIQNLSTTMDASGPRGGRGGGNEGTSRSDRLGPGIWKPSLSSVNSISSTSSPMNRKLQRGATWVTARESTSSIGGRDGSDHEQGIKEEDKEFDEEGEHFSLARVISQESDQGAGVVTATSASSSASAPAGLAGRRSQESGSAAADRIVKDLAISDDPASSNSSSSTSAKEPLSSTISKAGTRFGRALLNRAPTGLKRQNDMPVRKSGEPLIEGGSICSMDKDCQKSIDSLADKGRSGSNDADPKKHVRFLTKVQYQIAGASSRQPTLLTTHPVVKQDRMLVRKEVTERPGPHVFNSDTARRLERQSQGWKEWWCVMKGPPVWDSKEEKASKIRRKRKDKGRVEKGRLEFYYNHKKIKGTVVLSSCTSVSVYSSLDYSIAVTQNYPEALGHTIYIIRPRTVSLACAWYMEIYTLLHGAAPIPSFIEIAVPDFDVKIRVPIPEDSEESGESTDSESTSEEINDDEQHRHHQLHRGIGLTPTLPHQGPSRELVVPESQEDGETPFQSFRTAASSFPTIEKRLASKTFYLTNDDARPTLVAPDEVTPKLLRSHVLSLLSDVPDWTEVVRMWQDPSQHGDVALCWKRYDRIEWIYWGERVLAETDNMHLKKDHIGFADGSDWSGRMDETVVGPQVVDKTHVLELRPITHYPTKARLPGSNPIKELHEPDPIEGYLVRVSTFSGNPIRRFRRLYLTSHDHMLIYTIPSQSHSPTMQHAPGAIDPAALMFCITPHRSANPDHKDMAHSRSVRRLKAQVRAAKGFIDLTKVGSVRVLTVREWEAVRHLPYKKSSEGDDEDQKEGRRERLGKAVKQAREQAKEARQNRTMRGSHGSQDSEKQQQQQQQQQQQPPKVILREPDNYFFPTVLTGPVPDEGTSTQAQRQLQHQNGEEKGKGKAKDESTTELHASEPLNNSLGRNVVSTTLSPNDFREHHKNSVTGSFKNTFVKSATFVADLILQNDNGILDETQMDQDSNVIEIVMEGGRGPCVRFRAFNAEAARLWCDQVEKLAEYWRLRRHLDVKDHMAVTQANLQLSSMDDDEIQVGETIQDWDNGRAMASPQIWNWCVVNGCRSVTKSGVVYYKPKLHSTFRKMYLVLTEGYLMLFHPHRRSKASGQVIPTTTNKLFAIHALTDIYIYSGHFSDEDTVHGTNDESERLPRFFPDGLMVDDPDEDCTFSIWRGKRRKMFSRRGSAKGAGAEASTTMSSRAVDSNSRLFGKSGWFRSLVKDGVVYGGTPQSCGVYRARSRPDLEEWVYAINMEVERSVRAERRRIRNPKRN